MPFKMWQIPFESTVCVFILLFQNSLAVLQESTTAGPEIMQQTVMAILNPV